MWREWILDPFPSPPTNLKNCTKKIWSRVNGNLMRQRPTTECQWQSYIESGCWFFIKGPDCLVILLHGDQCLDPIHTRQFFLCNSWVCWREMEWILDPFHLPLSLPRTSRIAQEIWPRVNGDLMRQRPTPECQFVTANDFISLWCFDQCQNFEKIWDIRSPEQFDYYT